MSRSPQTAMSYAARGISQNRTFSAQRTSHPARLQAARSRPVSAPRRSAYHDL